MDVRALLLLPQYIFIGATAFIGIGFIIAFHEFGHFLFCKLFHIRTPSFSIGFGPRLITKKIWGTEFALSALPFGGYVEIAGAAEVGQGEQKEAVSTDKDSFVAKPWIQKFLVMIGGILFNLIFAYFTITLLYLTGMPKSFLLYPKNAIPTVQAIAPDSPAELAGIKAGDVIKSFDGVPVTSAALLIESIQEKPAQVATLTVERDEQMQEIPVTLGSRESMGKTAGFSGIVFAITSLEPYPFVDAVKAGIALTNEHIANTVYGFMHILAKKDTSGMMGPIGIAHAAIDQAKQGIKSLLLILSIISIALAVINLVPLPIFDGGQILFYTIEAIIGRSLPEKVREYIHIGTWIMVAILAVYLSAKDIWRIITHIFFK